MKQFDYKLLKSYRVYAQMTQEELAAKSGMSKSHISECESGKRNLSVRLFVKWAEVIGREPGEFFVEKQNVP